MKEMNAVFAYFALQSKSVLANSSSEQSLNTQDVLL